MGDELRVFRAHEFTVAVVICMDALEMRLWPRLADLGVNLIVIPAMSEKTASMASNAGLVVASCQAFVVLANGPASMLGHQRGSPDRHEAGFIGPYADATQPAWFPQPGGCPGEQERGFWRFDWSTREGEWRSTGR